MIRGPTSTLQINLRGEDGVRRHDDLRSRALLPPHSHTNTHSCVCLERPPEGWTDGPAFTGVLFRLCVSSNFIRVLAPSLFRKTGSFSGKHKLYIPHYSSAGTYLEMKHCIGGALTFFSCSSRAVFLLLSLFFPLFLLHMYLCNPPEKVTNRPASNRVAVCAVIGQPPTRLHLHC